MDIFFNKTPHGSLSDIVNDLKTYLIGLPNVTIVNTLYKGGDLSISNLLSNEHKSDVFFKQFKKNILIQPVDGTVIHKHNIDAMNKFDLIITPGNAGKAILLNNGVKTQIKVIPNYFKENIIPKKEISDKIIFYHESRMYKRKNILGLYESFIHSFSDNESTNKVKLIIKTSPGNIIKVHEEDLEALKFNYNVTPEIEIIDEYYDEQKLLQLWSNADVYVSFSHIEGFGIPLLNLASLEKPIITLKSDISGYMDFLTNNNSYFVESKKVVDTDFPTLYTKESEWDDIKDINECKNVMTSFLDDLNKGTIKTPLRDELEKFKYLEVMDSYLDVICSLLRVQIEKKHKKIKSNFHVSKIRSKGLKYVAPSGTSGYAEAAKNYILALNDILPVTYKSQKFDETENNISDADKKILKIKDASISWNHLLLHTTPEHWKRLLIEEGIDGEKNKQGIKIIGQTVWETDKIPNAWVEYCNYNLIDEIWVPTKWNKEVFEKSGVKTSIKVVPHIFMKEKLNGGTISNINDDDFVFYTIGQWTKRKGIAETIEAYCKAFTSKDKVCLVVKTFASNFSESEVSKCKYRINNILSNFTDLPKIVFIGDDCSREEILTLHNRGDCYISLCRAEGWGLGAFEAAGYGKPVIITGYGGQREFFYDDYELFVDYEISKVEPMKYFAWYDSSQNWSEPIVSDGVNKLKLVYENKEKYRNVGSKLMEHINANFRPDTVKEIMELIIK